MRKAWLAAGIAGFFGLVLSSAKRQRPEVSYTPLPTSDARAKIVRIAQAERGKQDPAKYWEGYPPREGNWCGAFTAWVLRQAGFGSPEPSWRWCLALPETSDPEPGDIAFFGPPNNHESIVVSVTPDTVTTVDGAQEALGKPSAEGLVMQRTRARSKVESFRSTADLIRKGTGGIV